MFSDVLDSEKFEKLLNWLNPDRETAGEKYESIRNRLIRIFNARGCFRAEELADDTIERVTKKIDNLSGTYEGEPAVYFYAVAKNVFMEYTRAPQTAELTDNYSHTESAEDDNEDDGAEGYHTCLDECLGELPRGQREFIIDFYKHTKAAKIAKRKQMAIDLGISQQTMRIRAFRIRDTLRWCISSCVERCAA